MDVYLIVLRMIHILAGVFWVGSALLFFFMIQPTAKALGPQAGPFMGHLTQQRKLPLVVVICGAVTIVAGLLLYWESSAGLDVDWITSGTGIGFTIGALSAIAGFTVGLIFIRPAVERMGAVRAEVQASGGPPSEAQASELQQLDARVGFLGRINVTLLTVAVILMAISRYL